MTKENVKGNVNVDEETGEVTGNFEQGAKEYVEETALAPMSEQQALTDLSIFKNPSMAMFSTISATDKASKIKIYNAIQNAGHVREVKAGEVLNIIGFIVHPVQFEGNDGDMQNGYRTVLIADDGQAYAAISAGVMSSLQKICGIVGAPSEEEPLKLAVVEKTTRKGFRTTTLEIVE